MSFLQRCKAPSRGEGRARPGGTRRTKGVERVDERATEVKGTTMPTRKIYAGARLGEIRRGLGLTQTAFARVDQAGTITKRHSSTRL